MRYSLASRLLCLLLLLGTLSLAHQSPRKTYNALHIRAELKANCDVSCTLETCGGGVCAAKRRRSLAPQNDFELATNHTLPNPEGLLHSFAKRVFARPNLGGRRTTALSSVRVYLRNVLLNPGVGDGTLNGPVQQFFGAEMETIGYQATFGNGAPSFQWGTDLLRGCTMFVIVSKRGAYMAHIWEGMYAEDETNQVTSIHGGFGWSDSLTGMFGIQWDRFALNVFKGTGDRDPESQVRTPPINWNLFNQAGDNTVVWFLTPGFNFGTSSRLYPNKIASLESMITANLPNAKIGEHIYRKLRYILNEVGKPVALDPKDTTSIADAATAVSQCFGCMLFQYDGAGAWRVFLEQTQWEEGATII